VSCAKREENRNIQTHIEKEKRKRRGAVRINTATTRDKKRQKETKRHKKRQKETKRDKESDTQKERQRDRETENTTY
jgi:hypothetical protein